MASNTSGLCESLVEVVARILGIDRHTDDIHASNETWKMGLQAAVGQPVLLNQRYRYADLYDLKDASRHRSTDTRYAISTRLSDSANLDSAKEPTFNDDFNQKKDFSENKLIEHQPWKASGLDSEQDSCSSSAQQQVAVVDNSGEADDEDALATKEDKTDCGQQHLAPAIVEEDIETQTPQEQIALSDMEHAPIRADSDLLTSQEDEVHAHLRVADVSEPDDFETAEDGLDDWILEGESTTSASSWYLMDM